MKNLWLICLLAGGTALAEEKAASAEPASGGAAGGEATTVETSSTPSTRDKGPHLQLTGAVLGDALGTYLGGEVRGSVSATRHLDVGLGANIGTSPGILITGRLHTAYSPDRVIRPFAQLRAAIHPASSGYGGGLFAGVLVEAGPGRIELGAGGHLYTDVTGYFSYAVFAMAGYELDVYGTRSNERAKPDRDRDGIENAVDKCPNDAEDHDGFQDEDGCPDPDNDSDGIADAVDKCPLEAEDMDAFQDDDGCPDLDNDADGVADGLDKCPLQAEDNDGFQDDDGCPETDNDADGIADTTDRCPNEAEDKDGFQDDDGCPDLDNDGDGIADLTDRCPMEEEVYNAFEDDDGCPDKGKPLAVVTSTLVEIKETVFFDTNRARIKKKSFRLLDAVSSAINTHGDMRVRIEGHTDYRGTDVWNQELSQHRAESVRDYLVNRGIDPSRLEAAGFGRSRPKIEGRRATARAANRRVEFVIIAPSPPPAPTPPTTPTR